MGYNKLKALHDNVLAIQTAWQLCLQMRNANAEEKAVLEKYNGFGGIKEVLVSFDNIDKTFEYSANVANGRQDIESIDESDKIAVECRNLSNIIYSIAAADKSIYRNIVQSVKTSVLTAFYTPKEVVQAVGDALRHTFDVFGIKVSLMLETSAGIGGFLPICQYATKKVAFEKDVLSSLVCRALNPDADVYNKCFETICSIDETNIKYDVVASNIPFGDTKVFDQSWLDSKEDIHRIAQTKIHAYFFIKAMEMLEDGGILAFVTSRGVADSESNDVIRRWLVNNGNLLAAIRLPDNLFMDGSGIEVGSDLIVFQRDCHKRWQSLEEDFFAETLTKIVDGIEIGPVNRLLSMQSKALFTHIKTDKDRFGNKMVAKYYWREAFDRLQSELSTRLNHDMERNFSKSAWVFGHSIASKRIEKCESNRTSLTKARTNNSATARMTASERKRLVEDMRPIYDALLKCYTDLMSNERINRIEFKEQRAELNRLYDEFVGKYGTLHKNEEFIKRLPEYQMMFSLERRNADKTYSKADVFARPVAFKVFDENTVLTPTEALATTLNEYGYVNMDYIVELCRLESDEAAYNALKGEIFFIPGTSKKENEWQHKTMCINGDVITKRKSIEAIIAESQDQYPTGSYLYKAAQDTIAALQEATPKPIPYDDIDIQLGVRWLPTDYFARFAQYIFHGGAPKITYISASDLFIVKEAIYQANDEGSHFGKYAVHCTACGRRYSGYEIFEFALIDKCPTITYTINEVKITDHEGMALVQKMIDKIRNEFLVFIKSNKISGQEREAIETLYNEKFNCYANSGFDGGFQTFPGLDFSNLGFSDLYQSQKDAIWMLKQNNGGVCWHSVGAGKSMIMCMTAYDMHRLGLCNKPIIIGLKANVAQIADTFRKAYPNGRLLYPGPDDFSAKNRLEFLNKIAANDWDCIIMTHDQFNRIPLTPEVEKDLMADEIDEIDAALDVISNHGNDSKSKKVIKGLEVRKQNLKVSIELRKSKLSKKADDVLTFRQLGIDFILVDEYQQFKNLAFTTRHNRVSGLGNVKGSSRSTHLLTCIRDIQQQKGRDMCAAFFSGTIITNALTELYVLFKYLRPGELKRQGISCFDAWAAVYINKSSELEIDLCNNIKEKERFRRYLNVPELTQFLRQITDFRTSDMINLDIPKRKEIQDIAEPTAEQKIMLDRLSKFATSRNWDDLGLPTSIMSNHLDKSIMLIATNLARKIALDPRLLDEDLFHDDPNNKAHRCAKNIYENYIEFNANRGTQFVFTDLSSYDKNKWNVSAEIRDILVNEYGIPSEEITFINLYESDTAKNKLFDKLNKGEIRVIFGSTQKLGTGVNAQQRAVAVHHLDAPWRPADLEQRDGRAVRHGNEVKFWGNNEVRIYIYGTKCTLDGYKFALLQNKALFIKQLNTLGTVSRHLDEDSVNESDGMSYGELKALLSGNEDLIELAKLDKKIKTLEAERDRFEKQARDAENSIARSKRNLENIMPGLTKSKNDFEYIMSKVRGREIAACIDPNDTKNSIVDADILSIDISVSQSVEDLGRAIKEIYFSQPEKMIKIGKYCGMDIVAFRQYEATIFAIKLGSSLYRCNDKGCDMKSFISSLTYFDGLLNKLANDISRQESSVRYEERNINAYKQLLNQNWDGLAEWMKLNEQYNAIQTRISADLAQKDKQREAELINEAKSAKK